MAPCWLEHAWRQRTGIHGQRDGCTDGAAPSDCCMHVRAGTRLQQTPVLQVHAYRRGCRLCHATSGRMGHVTWACRQQHRKLALRSSACSRESRLQGAHRVDAAPLTYGHTQHPLNRAALVQLLRSSRGTEVQYLHFLARCSQTGAAPLLLQARGSMWTARRGTTLSG